MMRLFLAAGWVVLSLSRPALAQITFNDLGSYCTAMSEAASPALVARTLGVQKSKAEDLMTGMTDPASIRMVKEPITPSRAGGLTGNRQRRL
jgi:hypothetical protein